MKKSLRGLGLILLGLLGVWGLSACSGKNKPGSHALSPTAAATGDGAGADAQTYAVPDQSELGNPSSDQGDQSYAYYNNPMHAPANQVYYFAFDSSGMRAGDMQALRVQAGYLVAHPNSYIRLEGNTDDRGSREYNIGLGWRRDQSVARVLEEQGVRPQQIQMVSYGKERPAVMGQNETAWALNRRVNLVYRANA